NQIMLRGFFIFLTSSRIKSRGSQNIKPIRNNVDAGINDPCPVIVKAQRLFVRMIDDVLRSGKTGTGWRSHIQELPVRAAGEGSPQCGLSLSSCLLFQEIANIFLSFYKDNSLKNVRC
ncbi:MAG: hypothetical protein ABW019_13400, partial [Chitinophagaceae bacterium]